MRFIFLIFKRMTTVNLSDYDPGRVPSASEIRFGIVVSDWNSEITMKLLIGVINTLKKHDAADNNIIVKHVPGSFELPLGAQFIAEYDDVDAIICLGCVIQGETPHFTYICQGVTQGITQLNLDYNIPFVFGVLTTANKQQALERAGGKHGNKGDEAAITAIKMAALQRQMEK
jgi:6,7-dimethyl-8-ribityllumazine synthase